MAKNIVLCFDGTGNNIGEDSTNIVKLFYLLHNDPEKQISFYHRGIATTDSGVVLNLFSYIKIGFQFLTGAGISKNIKDAYAYLIENYESGDKIYLFGFSRGAYTARSLAGMLDRVGLLHKNENALLAKAYNLYSDKVSSKTTEQFKLNHARSCPVYVIGAFDTVGSLIGNHLGKFLSAIISFFIIGFFSDRIIAEVPLQLYHFFNSKSWIWIFIFSLFYIFIYLVVSLVADFIEGHVFGVHKFHNTNLSSQTGYAFHALAIDERRFLFKPTLWNETSDLAKSKIQQVWFNGAHKDVGGYHKDQRLSDCSLQWMINRTKCTGLLLRSDYELQLHPDAEAPPKKIALYQRAITFFLYFYYRKIPNGAKIHPSVRWRIERKKHYPRNLKHIQFSYSEK